jgi:hypothetical protein
MQRAKDWRLTRRTTNPKTMRYDMKERSVCGLGLDAATWVLRKGWATRGPSISPVKYTATQAIMLGPVCSFHRATTILIATVNIQFTLVI